MLCGIETCTDHADVLSNPESRETYDKYGLDSSSHPGMTAGRGNAREAWDEFKPFRKENKRTRARDAAQAQNGATSAGDGLETAEDLSGGPLSLRWVGTVSLARNVSIQFSSKRLLGSTRLNYAAGCTSFTLKHSCSLTD